MSGTKVKGESRGQQGEGKQWSEHVRFVVHGHFPGFILVGIGSYGFSFSSEAVKYASQV